MYFCKQMLLTSAKSTLPFAWQFRPRLRVDFWFRFRRWGRFHRGHCFRRLRYALHCSWFCRNRTAPDWRWRIRSAGEKLAEILTWPWLMMSILDKRTQSENENNYDFHHYHDGGFKKSNLCLSLSASWLLSMFRRSILSPAEPRPRPDQQNSTQM